MSMGTVLFTALTGRDDVHRLMEVHQSQLLLWIMTREEGANSFLRRFLRSLSTYQCERHPALLVSHSDYNKPPLRIQPIPKSTPRELVITAPQNWYSFKPLLTCFSS